MAVVAAAAALEALLFLLPPRPRRSRPAPLMGGKGEEVQMFRGGKNGARLLAGDFVGCNLLRRVQSERPLAPCLGHFSR